jgi:ABC-type transport system involved in cytochrome bd biosynthesis fused ATPase/permease subunit
LKGFPQNILINKILKYNSIISASLYSHFLFFFSAFSENKNLKAEQEIILFLTMEPQLNLQKLQQLIKRGLSSIPIDDDADEAIIVIGDTGVGKSTIMNFLAGA